MEGCIAGHNLSDLINAVPFSVCNTNPLAGRAKLRLKPLTKGTVATVPGALSLYISVQLWLDAIELPDHIEYAALTAVTDAEGAASCYFSGLDWTGCSTVRGYGGTLENALI
jgi:hypothetical protein